MHNIECYKCGIVFGVTEERHQRLKITGDEFFCPNGHGQVYTKSTKVMLEDMTADRNFWKRQYKNARSERNHFERQKNGLYGYVAKLKKRLADE